MLQRSLIVPLIIVIKIRLHLNSELIIDGQRDMFLIRQGLKWSAPEACRLLEYGLAFEEVSELATRC